MRFPPKIGCLRSQNGICTRGNIGTHFGARFWFNFDECGIACVLVAYSVIVYSQAIVTFVILNPWSNPDILTIFQALLYNGLAELAKISHWRAMTTDPGAVPKEALPIGASAHWTVERELHGEGGGGGGGGGGAPAGPADVRARRRVCRRCHTFKPSRAHHCSQCRRCIMKMDHHCPWVNNCVGLQNHKFFLLFLLYVNLICLYSLGLSVYTLLHTCAGNSCASGRKISILCLVILAILFSLFTVCMMFDQYDAVTSNATKIDRLKGEVHEQNNETNEVFGGRQRRCSLLWLLPTRPIYPAQAYQAIYGYWLQGENQEDNTDEEIALEMSSLSIEDVTSNDNENERSQGPASLYRAARGRAGSLQWGAPPAARRAAAAAAKRAGGYARLRLEEEEEEEGKRRGGASRRRLGPLGSSAATNGGGGAAMDEGCVLYTAAQRRVVAAAGSDDGAGMAGAGVVKGGGGGPMLASPERRTLPADNDAAVVGGHYSSDPDMIVVNSAAGRGDSRDTSFSSSEQLLASSDGGKAKRR